MSNEPTEIVTVKGSGKPNPYIAADEVRTVQLTEHVQGLIDDGYAVVVEHNSHVQRYIDQGIAVDASEKARGGQ